MKRAVCGALLVALMGACGSDGALEIERVSEAGIVIVTEDLGPADDKLGVVPGNEGATIWPESFAVDDEKRLIYILDTVKKRIVTYDFSGRRLEATAIVGSSGAASDLVIDHEGNLVVLDDVQDSIYRINGSDQEVFDKLGISELGTQLTVLDDTVYLRDQDGDTHVPFLKGDRLLAPDERESSTRNGLPVDGGAIDLLVDGNDGAEFRRSGDVDSLTIVRPQQGYVVEVSDYTVDGTGAIWALISVQQKDVDNFEQLLVLIKDDSARGSVVDTGPVGDVTRLLAPMNSGVMVLEGDEGQLRLRRFRPF